MTQTTLPTTPDHEIPSDPACEKATHTQRRRARIFVVDAGAFRSKNDRSRNPIKTQTLAPHLRSRAVIQRVFPSGTEAHRIGESRRDRRADRKIAAHPDAALARSRSARPGHIIMPLPPRNVDILEDHRSDLTYDSMPLGRRCA